MYYSSHPLLGKKFREEDVQTRSTRFIKETESLSDDRRLEELDLSLANKAKEHRRRMGGGHRGTCPSSPKLSAAEATTSFCGQSPLPPSPPMAAGSYYSLLLTVQTVAEGGLFAAHHLPPTANTAAGGCWQPPLTAMVPPSHGRHQSFMLESRYD